MSRQWQRSASNKGPTGRTNQSQRETNQSSGAAAATYRWRDKDDGAPPVPGHPRRVIANSCILRSFRLLAALLSVRYTLLSVTEAI